MTALRERMLHDMRVRNLSPKTQYGYLRAVEGLARHCRKPPDQISQREVEDYIAHLFTERKYASGSCHGTVTGLRFFFMTTLRLQPNEFLLPSLRRSTSLPEILSTREVERLLAAVKNPKHRALLMTIRVEKGKGSKDRSSRPRARHQQVPAGHTLLLGWELQILPPHQLWIVTTLEATNDEVTTTHALEVVNKERID